MAKTLIGNIKGKDGRGISKIEKTATTGVIDTYTITYTDGTTSTYDVKNSDEVAIQRQIVPSAAVESSATASQAYSAGDYVVVGGVLRKVTSSIAIGSTIGDSNSAATTMTGEIATVLDSVFHASNYSAADTFDPASGWGAYGSGSSEMVGDIFELNLHVICNSTVSKQDYLKVGTIKPGLRPRVPALCGGNGFFGQVEVSGEIYLGFSNSLESGELIWVRSMYLVSK